MGSFWAAPVPRLPEWYLVPVWVRDYSRLVRRLLSAGDTGTVRLTILRLFASINSFFSDTATDESVNPLLDTFSLIDQTRRQEELNR